MPRIISNVVQTRGRSRRGWAGWEQATHFSALIRPGVIYGVPGLVHPAFTFCFFLRERTIIKLQVHLIIVGWVKCLFSHKSSCNMEGNLFSMACELVNQRKAIKWPRRRPRECKAPLVIAMLQALLQSVNSPSSSSQVKISSLRRTYSISFHHLLLKTKCEWRKSPRLQGRILNNNNKIHIGSLRKREESLYCL